MNTPVIESGGKHRKFMPHLRNTCDEILLFLCFRWVIKTNENVLHLLRQYQHIFYEDDMIKHYIRDSDVWQSYKRSQIMELLAVTNMQFISVKKKDIQETLERALEFGDGKRFVSCCKPR